MWAMIRIRLPFVITSASWQSIMTKKEEDKKKQQSEKEEAFKDGTE
jgi:hypothetical protein